MSNKVTIAGVSITLNFCKKINETPIPSDFRSKQPIVNIYKNTTDQDIYVVNIVSYLPESLKALTDMDLNSGLILNKDATLFLSYTGVNIIKTSINKPDNGALLCREFNILYDFEDTYSENYNLYHIQFDYKLLSTNFQSVEAIIVHDINEDPETDRGTVTTVRTDDQ